MLCNPLMFVIKVKVALEYISVSDKKRGWAASASPAVVAKVLDGGGEGAHNKSQLPAPADSRKTGHLYSELTDCGLNFTEHPAHTTGRLLPLPVPKCTSGARPAVRPHLLTVRSSCSLSSRRASVHTSHVLNATDGLDQPSKT